MKTLNSNSDLAAAKDGSAEQRIPTAWRATLRAIVSAFVKGDYGLEAGVPGVEAITPATALHIQDSVRAYGATLVELPDATWESSVCMWYEPHWDALVELWTQDEGRSDLALSVRVTEADNGFRFTVHMVYVP